jgi:phosphoribosylformylglycinamidine synthase
MTAYELLLSESQERMLVVVKKGHEEEVKKIFDKWDLHAETIGAVTDEERLQITYRGKLVADLVPDTLVLGGAAPVYHRDRKRPQYLEETQKFDQTTLTAPCEPLDALRRLLASPNIASKRWVYEQYDSMVRTNNMILSGSDAAVVLIKQSEKALAVKTDCNGRYVYLNPRIGGMIAVAEAARNVTCTGATPLAITNCLNFGNPYKPEVYWQFAEAVEGIGEACRFFDTPVTGGNVSFYNESPDASVYPTPVIGMLGIIEDLDMVTQSGFQEEGDIILLLGETVGHLGGSEYLSVIHGIVSGDAPALNLTREQMVQTACRELIREGVIRSAHDCSDGGLGVALAECCIVGTNPVGAQIKLLGKLRTEEELFGEDQSRIVITVRPEDVDAVIKVSFGYSVPVQKLGVVGGTTLRISGIGEVSVGELRQTYNDSMSKTLER